jgi:Family of unknown function (DUF6879)
MLRVLGGSCNDADTCPRVLEEPDVSDDVFVEGYNDVDPKLLAEASPPPGGRLVRVPRGILIDAGRRLERQALFASVTDSAFRLETLPQYLVAQEDERFRAFREGRPLPARSAETSPWLRQIARSTAGGRHWQRIHVVGRPLTAYLRFELLTDSENVAAGEDVRVADRDIHAELTALTQDFWLIDGDTDHATALLMRYDPEGRFADAERCTDPDVLARCRHQRDLALARSIPVADYLARGAA